MRVLTTWRHPVDGNDEQVDAIANDGLGARDAVMTRLDVADELAEDLDARARARVAADDVRERDGVLVAQLLERRRALVAADEAQRVAVGLVDGPGSPDDPLEVLLPGSSRRRITGACDRGATLYLRFTRINLWLLVRTSLPWL